MIAPDLTPFAKQAQAARSGFANRSATNTFAKNRSAQMGARAQTDFTQGFNRSLPKFTSGFGQRGLAGGGMQSGVMQNAMQQFVGDYTRDTGRMQEDLFAEQKQFDFNQSRFTADRDAELANIHAAKQATIAQTAQHIAALKPYAGGYF